MTSDELAAFVDKATAEILSSQAAEIERMLAGAAVMGTGATLASCDGVGGVTLKNIGRRWSVIPYRPSAPLAWGERFEVSPAGKIKKNKRAQVFVTYDMDARYSPVWRDPPAAPASCKRCYFMEALWDLDCGRNEANMVLNLNSVQQAMFIDRVKNSKIRTPFLDQVFTRAVALRMGGG